MECIKSLLNKSVINIKTGENIGCVCDVLVDTTCGLVAKIVVSESNNVLSIFSKDNFFYISWCDVVKVGEDLILVDANIHKRKN